MAVELRPTPIRVAAPPEVVYDVLADVRSWGRWSPEFKVVGRRATAGAPVLLVVGALPGPPLVLPARLDRTERGETFSWGTGLPGLLDARHGFSLQPDGDGTLVRHWEVMTGPAAVAAGPVRQRLEQAYERMNAGLRAHVEALVA